MQEEIAFSGLLVDRGFTFIYTIEPKL